MVVNNRAIEPDLTTMETHPCIEKNSNKTAVREALVVCNFHRGRGTSLEKDSVKVTNPVRGCFENPFDC